MNALATISGGSEIAPGFAEWLAAGKALLDKRNEIEWSLGDWLATGRETFGDQAQFDYLGEQLGIAPKRLRTAVKVATAFPPAYRSAQLSFAVHEEIARVDEEDRLSLLNRAASERWHEKRAHEEVEHRRVSVAPARMMDDDEEDRLGVVFIRAWNRMPTPEAREAFWPYLEHAAANGFTAINLDEVLND